MVVERAAHRARWTGAKAFWLSAPRAGEGLRSRLGTMEPEGSAEAPADDEAITTRQAAISSECAADSVVDVDCVDDATARKMLACAAGLESDESLPDAGPKGFIVIGCGEARFNGNYWLREEEAMGDKGWQPYFQQGGGGKLSFLDGAWIWSQSAGFRSLTYRLTSDPRELGRWVLGDGETIYYMSPQGYASSARPPLSGWVHNTPAATGDWAADSDDALAAEGVWMPPPLPPSLMLITR